MNKRKAKSADFVITALKKSLIPRNQIAAISGLTNTYIRDLEQGKIANVGREKLIALAVSMNLTLNEIDEMLTIFDRAKLDEDDVTTFIETSKQMRISSVLHPLRDYYGYELLALAAELISGHKAVVANYPTAVLFAEGYRSYVEQDKAIAHPLYLILREAIGRERKRNLAFQLSRYRMDHYIDKESLERYLIECEDPIEKNWRYKHVESVIWHLRNYQNFRYYITSIHPGFTFLIKFSEENDEAEKVFFQGHSGPVIFGKLTGQLAGFFTENEIIVQQFNKDLGILRNHTLEEYLDREKLVSYFEALIST